MSSMYHQRRRQATRAELEEGERQMRLAEERMERERREGGELPLEDQAAPAEVVGPASRDDPAVPSLEDRPMPKALEDGSASGKAAVSQPKALSPPAPKQTIEASQEVTQYKTPGPSQTKAPMISGPPAKTPPQQASAKTGAQTEVKSIREENAQRTPGLPKSEHVSPEAPTPLFDDEQLRRFQELYRQAPNIYPGFVQGVMQPPMAFQPPMHPLPLQRPLFLEQDEDRMRGRMEQSLTYPYRNHENDELREQVQLLIGENRFLKTRLEVLEVRKPEDPVKFSTPESQKPGSEEAARPPKEGPQEAADHQRLEDRSFSAGIPPDQGEEVTGKFETKWRPRSRKDWGWSSATQGGRKTPTIGSKGGCETPIIGSKGGCETPTTCTKGGCPRFEPGASGSSGFHKAPKTQGGCRPPKRRSVDYDHCLEALGRNAGDSAEVSRRQRRGAVRHRISPNCKSTSNASWVVAPSTSQTGLRSLNPWWVIWPIQAVPGGIYSSRRLWVGTDIIFYYLPWKELDIIHCQALSWPSRSGSDWRRGQALCYWWPFLNLNGKNWFQASVWQPWASFANFWSSTSQVDLVRRSLFWGHLRPQPRPRHWPKQFKPFENGLAGDDVPPNCMSVSLTHSSWSKVWTGSFESPLRTTETWASASAWRGRPFKSTTLLRRPQSLHSRCIFWRSLNRWFIMRSTISRQGRRQKLRKRQKRIRWRS